jgi:sensor histidine kinase YesM
MNPHFIFISLNSINYYLSINDPKNADNYNDPFSSILKSFPENGSKDFMELIEELKILTSYLELEKQRMIPAFTYFIDLEAATEHQQILFF